MDDASCRSQFYVFQTMRPRTAVSDGWRNQRLRSECKSSCALAQEFGESSDRIHSVFTQSPQIFLSDSLFGQESPYIYQSRTTRVVPTIDLFTTLGQAIFQVRQILRLLDLAA